MLVNVFFGKCNCDYCRILYSQSSNKSHMLLKIKANGEICRWLLKHCWHNRKNVYDSSQTSIVQFVETNNKLALFVNKK